MQAEAAPGDKTEERGRRHDAESADLEHQQDCHLPERRPVTAGIDYHQPRHRDGGGGSKEGGEQGRAGAVSRRDRQAQQ